MDVNLESKEVTLNKEELQFISSWGRYTSDDIGGLPEDEQKLLDALIEAMAAAGIVQVE
jgi:hypothetical protein